MPLQGEMKEKLAERKAKREEDARLKEYKVRFTKAENFYKNKSQEGIKKLQNRFQLPET
jgi:hypothetical protein